MVKGVNVEQGVKGDYVAIRVIIPRSTYKALKVKCALNDITVISRRCIKKDILKPWPLFPASLQ